MPYVITTTRTLVQKPGTNDLGQTVVQSARRAVATLDGYLRRALTASRTTGAREQMISLAREVLGIDHDPDDATVDAIADAYEAQDCFRSGGTVGPLPDGTVIEVEQIGWIDFELTARRATGADGELPSIDTFDDDHYRAELIDAYNAAQEEG